MGKIGRPMSRHEEQLLLYLETCLVDGRGLVASVHMNGEDFDTARKWNKESFIGFGRRKFAEIEADSTSTTHWVKFTDQAWIVAHQLRRERAERHVRTTHFGA